VYSAFRDGLKGRDKGGVAPDSNFLGAEAHIFCIHKSKLDFENLMIFSVEI
jgi:hypothetical protein